MNLSETDIRSPRATAWIVRSDVADTRPWLASAPVCAALAHHSILHVAVADMPSPFRIVRTKLGGSYFLASFDGEGRVLIDGRWMRCRAGVAVLLPPGTLQAFHTPPRGRWQFCWVRYQERHGQKPLAAVQTPVVGRFDAEPLRLAILGLYRECTTSKAPASMEHWGDLVHHYVLSFAQPASMDPRLWRLWESVAVSLDHPWTVTEMANAANMSEKHLERLCRKELGRPPRQQLIWLRMRRAADLLTSSQAKIETIAARVCYQNPFVFSSTFKRVMGYSPSNYPGRRR